MTSVWEFDCDNKRVEEECPEVKKSGKKIVLSKTAIYKILVFLKKHSETEWGGYLVGEEQEEQFKIDDIVFPNQKVTGAHVEFEEEKFPEKCIGWIHSHNNMDSHLSKTDSETSLMYKITMVVNNNFEFAAGYKTKLSCGREALVESEVDIEITDDITKELDKVSKKPDYVLAFDKPNGVPAKWLPDNDTCQVCGFDLPKKERKKRFCYRCSHWVHKRCYNEEMEVCSACLEELSNGYREEYIN